MPFSQSAHQLRALCCFADNLDIKGFTGLFLDYENVIIMNNETGMPQGPSRRLGIDIVLEMPNTVVHWNSNRSLYSSFSEMLCSFQSGVIDDIYAKLVKNNYKDPERIYRKLGSDTATALSMQAVAVGAEPFYAGFHLFASTEWLEDTKRPDAVNRGFKEASERIGFDVKCRHIPMDGHDTTIKMITGNLHGTITNGKYLIKGDSVSQGDSIFGLLTDVPDISEFYTIAQALKTLHKGYFCKLSENRAFVDSILTPTPSYNTLIIKGIYEAAPHYVIPVIGGWENMPLPNIVNPDKPASPDKTEETAIIEKTDNTISQKKPETHVNARYVIDNLPELLEPPKLPEAFKFLTDYGRTASPDDFSDQVNYGRWSMGVSALLIGPRYLESGLRRLIGADRLKILGHVEKSKDGLREIVFTQKHVRYTL